MNSKACYKRRSSNRARDPHATAMGLVCKARNIILAGAAGLTIISAPTLLFGEENPVAPDGTALAAHQGTLRIVEDNTVVSNMVITGDVIIEADNVTLKNVTVLSMNDLSAVHVMDGADNFTLTDSTIDGQGRTHSAVDGYGTFLRNDIKGAENGINVTGPALIQDNYIHGLRNKGSPHYDGIQVDGGRDVRIINNTIINENTQTSAVMLDNYFRGLSNVTVENNRLYGGGYVLYVDASFEGGPVDNASIRIINNGVGGAYYGDFAFTQSKPIAYGNVPLKAAPEKGQ
jgi:hypothetical protein